MKQALCIGSGKNYQEFMSGEVDKLDTVFIDRSDCEDPANEFLQLIPYVVFFNINFAEKRINFFKYTRSADNGDERLRDKLSLGIGGHIDAVEDLVFTEASVEDDLTTFHLTTDDIRASVLKTAKREIIEELNNPEVADKIDKFINNLMVFKVDSGDEVDSVHLCCLLPVELNGEEFGQILGSAHSETEIAEIGIFPIKLDLLLSGMNISKNIGEMLNQISTEFNIETWSAAAVDIISNMVCNFVANSVTYEDYMGIVEAKLQSISQLTENTAAENPVGMVSDTSIVIDEVNIASMEKDKSVVQQ